MILSSCQKEDDYQPQEITIHENQKEEKSDDSLQIDGLYEVTDDADIYADMDEETAFDKLEKGKFVKIEGESENGFVRVELDGDSFYIKTKYLKEI